MKVTSKNYDGKLYIKLGRKHIPLEETVEYFENLEKENEQLKQQIVGKENEFKYFSNSFQFKIKELKQQIEKMKCCANCTHGKQGERDCCGECFYCNVDMCMRDVTGDLMHWECAYKEVEE